MKNKKQKIKHLKNNKGITLVALVVTIIVLIILAGISINLILGDNGIIKKAQEARQKAQEAQENEINILTDYEKYIETITNANNTNSEQVDLINVRDEYEHHPAYINYQGDIMNEPNSVYIRVPVKEDETWFVWFKEPTRLGSCELRYENSSYEKVSYLNMKNQPKYHFNKESSKYGAVMEIPEGVSHMCVTLKFANYWDCTDSAIIAKVNKKFETTLLTFGDSLTEFNNTALRNWLHLSSEKISGNYFNLAKSGMGYLYNGGFSTTFKDIPSNANINLALFFGSFNDMSSNAEIGSATDIYVEGADNSLAACMNYSYDYIRTNYPNTKIAVISPTPWSRYNSFTEGREQQYVAVMQEICELKEIPFLNLFETSGLMPWDAEYNNKYYYNADGTHPNDEGHKIIASKIIPFLQSVLKK